jgi:hypothetical protein
LGKAYGTQYGLNDIVGVLLNLTSNKIYFYVAGQLQGVAYTNISGPVSFAVTLHDQDEVEINPNAIMPPVPMDSNVSSSVGIQSSDWVFNPIPGAISVINKTMKSLQTGKPYTAIGSTTFSGTGKVYFEVKIYGTSNPSRMMIGFVDGVVLSGNQKFLSDCAYGYVSE